MVLFSTDYFNIDEKYQCLSIIYSMYMYIIVKLWNAIAALRSISYYMNWYLIYMQ